MCALSDINDRPWFHGCETCVLRTDPGAHPAPAVARLRRTMPRPVRCERGPTPPGHRIRGVRCFTAGLLSPIASATMVLGALTVDAWRLSGGKCPYTSASGGVRGGCTSHDSPDFAHATNRTHGPDISAHTPPPPQSRRRIETHLYRKYAYLGRGNSRRWRSLLLPPVFLLVSRV